MNLTDKDMYEVPIEEWVNRCLGKMIKIYNDNEDNKIKLVLTFDETGAMIIENQGE